MRLAKNRMGNVTVCYVYQTVVYRGVVQQMFVFHTHIFVTFQSSFRCANITHTHIGMYMYMYLLN